LDKVQLTGFDRWFLIVFFFLSIFGDFIANDKPIIYKKEGQWSMPIIAEYLSSFKWNQKSGGINQDWHAMDYDFLVRTPVPYSASYIDLKNAKFISPLDSQDVKSPYYRHWLGTDSIGRDVLAGLIHGCRIAFIIGILSTLFALFIGLPLGTAMGYWGNQQLKTSLPGCLVIIVGGLLIFAGCLVAFQLFLREIYPLWQVLLFMIVVAPILTLLYSFLKNRLDLFKRFPKSISIPLDHLGMRIIEILRSIPGLFLVLACLGLMVRPSVFFISFLIGFIRWPTIARYVRAEVMKVKSMGYIKSAETLGLSRSQIVFRHMLPNALSPVLVTIAFGFSSAILVESALSFLGLGLSIEEMSWGKLLNQARSDFDAWWLVFFPGMMIFLTIYVFNRIGSRVNAVFNPRLGTE
jgi:peptide/nickel transport system permease protein